MCWGLMLQDTFKEGSPGRSCCSMLVNSRQTAIAALKHLWPPQPSPLAAPPMPAGLPSTLEEAPPSHNDLGLPSTLLIVLYVPVADPLQRTWLLDPLPLSLTVKGQLICFGFGSWDPRLTWAFKSFKCLKLYFWYLPTLMNSFTHKPSGHLLCDSPRG